MKFNTVAEAFNHYRTATLEEIEKRTAEIKGIIERDSNADINGLNIEIEGLRQAKENAKDKTEGVEQRGFNPITGADFETRAGYDAISGDVLSSAEYRSAFYKTLLGRELTPVEDAAFKRAIHEQRADAYATSSSVAAVLPTTTLNEVVSKARTMGGMLSVCRSFNVPSKISIPVGTPTEKAAWNTEGAAVDSEEPDITYVAFDGYEILKVFSISAKVKAMSIPAFESYLAEELASSVIACLGDGVVNGTGTNQGTGILNGVTWTEDENMLTLTQPLDYFSIAGLVAMLKRGYANGAKWVMSNATLYNAFYGLTDTNGRPIFITDPKTEGIGKVLGFDVVVDDFMPNDEVLFGNFNYMGYNLPEGITVEASTQSSFKSGRIDYRALAVADCKPIVEEAFIKLVLT